MKIADFYPIIVSDALFDCRDFYVRWFGLEVGFESTWFIWMKAESVSIAFMHPEHPSTPPGPEPFSGKGMCLEFQVEDVQAEYDRFIAGGAPVTYHLKDEPFGQRRFGLFDPAGVWIDIVEQIEPTDGWWDKYMLPS